MHPPPIVFFVVTPCPLREINPLRHVIKTQYKMFKRRTKNMKKTLLVLISIIAVLALVGCNAETQSPSTEDPSTPSITGAVVATRAFAMMSLGTPSEENTISFSEDKTIVDSDLANNESLVVGDVIKADSKASITYDADNSQLNASAEITVVIGATEYKISGDVKFGVNKDDLALSVVSADGLTISDTEGTELAISNEDLVKAMASFSERIADIVNGSATEESKIPSWIREPTPSYIGTAYNSSDLETPIGELALDVTDTQFTIMVYLTAQNPDDPSTGIKVSANEADIVVNTASTDTEWIATLNNVQMNNAPFQLPINITVTQSETTSGTKQLTVEADVVIMKVTAILTEKTEA